MPKKSSALDPSDLQLAGELFAMACERRGLREDKPEDKAARELLAGQILSRLRHGNRDKVSILSELGLTSAFCQSK